jgi:heme/copper-type cytochrome/quinol oxidase subunit 2
VVWGVTELATITAYSYGSVAPNEQPNSKKALTVNVTGQQWVWTFEYPDEQGIVSPTLVVPIGRPVYFNVTSVDVVHNFWVVELGVKIDANPGAVTNTGVTPDKPGHVQHSMRGALRTAPCLHGDHHQGGHARGIPGLGP